MLKRLLYIVPWLLAFGLLLTYHHLFSFDELFSTSLALSLIDIACLYAAVWVINRYLVPRLLGAKKTAWFMLALLAVMYLFSQVLYLLDWFFYSIKGIDGMASEVFHTFRYQIFSSYMPVFLGCMVSLAYRLSSDRLASQMRYEALQKEKAQAELNFLKAQINPHFLFNSINSIYAHIDRNNHEARDMVLKFSEMLRYQLYECNTDSIAIEKEIAFLGSYIEIQKTRKEKTLQVDFDVQGHIGDFGIPPLLLIPFVENAFKYASTHEDKENLLIIRLSRSNGSFSFYCSNTRDRTTARSLADEGGIGIGNVKRRLELLYEGRYQLDIRDNEHNFEVDLTLKTI